MRLTHLLALSTALFLLASCGEDDSESLCQSGCEATIAADCSNGPSSQSVCESDCNSLLTGSCASFYQAYLDCAQGRSVSCDGSGFPTVIGCEAEQSAFLGCL